MFFKILCLLAITAIIGCSGSSFKQLTDHEILEEIYFAMNGPQWNDSESENWLSDKPIGEWKGVTTNDEGRVVKLIIEADTVIRVIPAGIGGLSALEELTITIKNNNVANIIPTEIGELTNLKQLKLKLSFFIPMENRPVLPDLTTLVNLEHLYLSGFKGAIPENIGQLKKLESLYLGSFEWKIPESICGLTNLEKLEIVSTSQPEGAVPECIGKLSNLKRLKIDYSLGMAGAIKQPNAKFPESVWDLTNLEYLNLRTVSNSGGPIPGDKVAKMTNLNSLTINDCGVTGEIPSELFLSGKLTDLIIYRNELTGSIPIEIGNCLKLSTIKLTHNQLTGNIPEELAKCEKLSTCDLSGNQISPNIPKAIKEHPKFSNFKF